MRIFATFGRQKHFQIIFRSMKALSSIINVSLNQDRVCRDKGTVFFVTGMKWSPCQVLAGGFI